MRFGVMLLGDLPSKRIVELAQKAEEGGFEYLWLNDCDLLYRNPWPIFAQIADSTRVIKLGPLVTNPVTRDWSVTAGLLATLNEMSDGRMVCGVGRGDLAVRTIGKRAATVAELDRFINAIRDLVEGRETLIADRPVRIEWALPTKLEMWGAAYGPKTLGVVGRSCDGYIMQAADPALIKWALTSLHDAATGAQRNPIEIEVMVAAPAYIGDDLSHASDQTRWFGGVVLNHVGELVRRHGDGLARELGLTSSDLSRQTIEVAAHGAREAEQVSDELSARFGILGEPTDHVARLKELEQVGVTAITLYVNHDALERTMDAYMTEVIPAFR